MIFALLEESLEEALLSKVGIKLALGVSLGDLDGCRDDGCKPGREREDEQEHGSVFEVHGVILSFFLMGVKGLVVFSSLFQNEV